MSRCCDRVTRQHPDRLLTEDPAVGLHACAIGNSFGLGLSFSCGVVSAVHRRDVGFNAIEDFVQTDAAINPGASGGALVDPQGHLIGLIDGIFTKEADIDAGVNFAISVPMLRNPSRRFELRNRISRDCKVSLPRYTGQGGGDRLVRDVNGVPLQHDVEGDRYPRHFRHVRMNQMMEKGRP